MQQLRNTSQFLTEITYLVLREDLLFVKSLVFLTQDPHTLSLLGIIMLIALLDIE